MLHHNELITIEEETILNVPSSRNGMQRKFTLTNRGSKFSFSVLSSGGSIVSIKVNDGTHEVVLPTSLVSYLPFIGGNNPISSSSFGQSNRRDLDSYPVYCEWTSHVLGSDTLLLTAPSSQSVIYQLTSSDEFIITGKVKNFHAIAPFYLNLNCTTSTITGHYLHLKCLHPTYYEIIACPPPSNGSNYNSIIGHTANSGDDVNSTTNNASSVTIELPLRFDIITGSILTAPNERSVGGVNEGQNGSRNSDQRGPLGHSSLIQDAVYAIVPVISSNNNEGVNSNSLVSGNVSSSNNSYLPFEGSSETAVASSSGNCLGESNRPLTPSMTLPVVRPTICTTNSRPPPPPVLLLTLSYEGRSIEMSLQSNSSSNSSQNNGTLASNLLPSNSTYSPFVSNGSSPSTSSFSTHSLSSSSPSSLSSSSSSSTQPSSSNSNCLPGTLYDSVKLRVRIRKDGISFMPVGMNDFKCIYKVKW